MAFLLNYLESLAKHPIPVLDSAIPLSEYCSLDLSISNAEIKPLKIHDSDECQKYISSVLSRSNAQVAFGGYLEKRSIYADKSNFKLSENRRDIHLGMDFWAEAGTQVIAPLSGTVHSFQNNEADGDYGPTIIMQHTYGQHKFHTLYGHLSLESLQGLDVGMKIREGEVIATLGTPEINVGYAPHLHFQIVEDMQGYHGDYPGVCSEEAVPFYSKNCPDPMLLLRLP